jgi:tetrahydromethanopterin S-methyltransferase subunit G
MDVAEWNNFFIMVGGGAAALAGLVFIAISINISAVTHDATHKNRAIATLTGFTGVFMVCAFALIGKLGYRWLGAEWLVVTLVPMTTYVRVYRRARAMGRSTVGLDLGRFIQQTGCYVGQIIGSVLLLFGYVAGLYVASVFMVLSFAFFISGAWLLITGIQADANPD